jgi:HK97 gp10 family phage protein
MPTFTPSSTAGAAPSTRGGLRIEGTERLINKLKQIEQQIDLETEDILASGAEVIRERAEQNAPRGRGELAQHIIVDKDFNPDGTIIEQDVQGNEGIVAIGPDMEHYYGLFPEIGTKDQPAQPWLRPAFDETHDTAEKRVIAEINAIINEHTILGI